MTSSTSLIREPSIPYRYFSRLFEYELLYEGRSSGVLISTLSRLMPARLPILAVNDALALRPVRLTVVPFSEVPIPISHLSAETSALNLKSPEVLFPLMLRSRARPETSAVTGSSKNGRD